MEGWGGRSLASLAHGDDGPVGLGRGVMGVAAVVVVFMDCIPERCRGVGRVASPIASPPTAPAG